jgi:hypothetical protein
MHVILALCPPEQTRSISHICAVTDVKLKQTKQEQHTFMIEQSVVSRNLTNRIFLQFL